ncbi:hypothetical protein SAMN05518855_1001616 [Paenibacillus sp. CF384]|nr:ChbG/HpnK family deacetylase [Paenibacillus sp. CF384]SDW19703.1 hypothetical protein SAMN05518855_1001616 [Paenibacillus sp. CF384]
MLHRLGCAAEDRLLIINADDLGITQGTNEAVSKLFASRAISSASIMMPCPGAREAAQLCLQDANSHIGIHLTLSSEQTHPYQPVYQKGSLSSLVTADGFFHSDLSYIEHHGDPEEIRCELEAQIQLALALGIDPTHLDSHGGTIMGLAGGRDFLEIAIDLCENTDFPLTCRNASWSSHLFHQS